MAKKQLVKTMNEYWTYPDMNHVIKTALYYGFTPTRFIESEKKEPRSEAMSIHPEEKAALLKSHFSNNPQPPLAFVYERRGDKKVSKKIEYCFDICGALRSIADATIIKTLYEIARDEGHQNIVVEINSVGDRDSFVRFVRELGVYFRKHINELSPECRQLFKKNPLSIITCTHEKCQTIKERAPRPMNYLSEPSRHYFMEVLELLEKIDIPYTINNTLIENHEHAAHTTFRLLAPAPDGAMEWIAGGTRWTNIAKKIGLKKDVPSVSGSIFVSRPEKREKKTKIQKPKIYFIQMGQEAKLKSLKVIETLRQANIPLYHALAKDKLTTQLMTAEHLKVPYILIMGQKESMENTLLIREMNNRSQDTIRMERVAEYLAKKIRS